MAGAASESPAERHPRHGGEWMRGDEARARGRRLGVILLALGWAAGASGCESGGGAGGMTNPRVPPPGSSDYQAAYLVGCDSGYADAGWAGWENKYSRDPGAFQSSAEYHKGWVDGYRACFKYADLHRRPTMPAGQS